MGIANYFNDRVSLEGLLDFRGTFRTDPILVSFYCFEKGKPFVGWGANTSAIGNMSELHASLLCLVFLPAIFFIILVMT